MNSKSNTIWSERVKIIAVLSFPVLWPFLNFLNTNRDENYSLLRLCLYGAVTLIAVLLGFILFQFIFKKYLTVKRASTIYSVGVISFFCYQVTYQLAHSILHGYYLKTWAGFALVSFLIAWFMSRARTFQNFILVLCIVLPAVPASQYLAYQAQILLSSDEKIGGTKGTSIAARSGTFLPSVYHIILDEYARADVLSSAFDFDNNDFLNRLKSKGFFIVDEAMSNYGRTGLSVPSILAMEYLFHGDFTPQSMAISKELSNGRGPVFEWFQESGYYTALLSYQGSYCESGLPDYCFSAASILYGELESNLIALTPFNSLTDYIISKKTKLDQAYLSQDYFELWDAREFVAELKTEKPVFSHIHALTPHTPHRFSSTCEVISLDQQQNNSESYIENLECANIGALELVDTILERNPNSIIILQSDHGARKGVVLDNVENSKWEQNFSILSAWRIPPNLDCHDEIHSNLTLVNTFRIVQGCISETATDLLPNRWFAEDLSNKRYVEIFKK